MSNEVDFEQFIKLLDGALASDDKNIQQALRKFLFVAAMVLGDDCEPGPFTKMMETMDDLQRRLATLEQPTVTPQPYDWYGGSSPTFPGTAGGTWCGGSITSTGTTIPYTNTNAISTTTTASNTGNITFSNTTGYSYLPTTTSGTTTITMNDYAPKPAKTGTDIKDEIMEALDRLANVA